MPLFVKTQCQFCEDNILQRKKINGQQKSYGNSNTHSVSHCTTCRSLKDGGYNHIGFHSCLMSLRLQWMQAHQNWCLSNSQPSSCVKPVSSVFSDSCLWLIEMESKVDSEKPQSQWKTQCPLPCIHSWCQWDTGSLVPKTKAGVTKPLQP